MISWALMNSERQTNIILSISAKLNSFLTNEKSNQLKHGVEWKAVLMMVGFGHFLLFVNFTTSKNS